MTVYSQNGNTVVESNTGQSYDYGTKQDMGITAQGNINKTPGLGLTEGGADYDAKYATYLKLFSGEMIKGSAYCVELTTSADQKAGTNAEAVIRGARARQEGQRTKL